MLIDRKKRSISHLEDFVTNFKDLLTVTNYTMVWEERFQMKDKNTRKESTTDWKTNCYRGKKKRYEKHFFQFI